MAFLLSLLVTLLASPPLPGKPVRMSATVFGSPAEIEVRDLPAEAARQAIQQALAEMAAVERLTDPEDSEMAGGLAALNAAAGRGPQAVDARLLPALGRALDFCEWSERAFGPLGRDLNRLWGLRSPVGASPLQKPEILDRALVAADCGQLRIDAEKKTANLAAGSAVDLWGFAEGLAVDQAVEVLRREGVRNGYVHVGRVGGVYRGFGKGPDGRGWSVAPPLAPGTAIPLTLLFLQDKALAIASLSDRPLKIGEETFSPWISHRTGQPVQGTVATLAVTDLALDAQGLAATLTITGPTEGQLRLGSLRPSPSMLWLQGSGVGEPLQITYHWSDVPKR